MPMEFRDVDGGLGNLITGSGVVTDDEFLGFFQEFFSQQEGKLAKYRFSLSDYAAVTELELTADTVRRFVSLSKAVTAVNPDTLAAVYAPQPYSFGLARMWENLMDETDWETRVFVDRDVAVAWLRKRAEEKYGLENLTFA